MFQGRLPSDGKVTASREDMRFQADLLDFSKRASSQEGGEKYALVVTNLFTKEAWVERMTEKTDAEAKSAMRKILAQNDNVAPKEVSVDLGREFGPSFQQFLEDKGVVVRKKDPQQVNTLAGVDRAQQSIKSILKHIFAIVFARVLTRIFTCRFTGVFARVFTRAFAIAFTTTLT